MKKFIITLLAVLALCSFAAFAGCNNNKTDNKQPPVISGGDKIYVLTGSDEALENMISAADEDGNPVSVTVADSGGYDVDTAGSYTVRYTAENDGATAEKTVTVEVVDPAIDVPAVFMAGQALVITQPAPTSSASSVTVSLAYRLSGAANWQDAAFTDGSASLDLSESGSYEFRFTYNFDGQTAETTVSAEAYTVSVPTEKRTATVGEAYEVAAPVFSENVSGTYTVSYKADGAENWTPLTADQGRYTITFPISGYYTVRYSGQCGETQFNYDFELYARESGMDIDLEGADGTHYGEGDKQADIGEGQTSLTVSDEWAHDGRYSLLHDDHGSSFWSGIEFSRPRDVEENSNVLVCYIYSRQEYNNVQMCVYYDGDNYVEATPFTIREGEHKYYISFNGTFSQVKILQMQANSSSFYIDALDFTNLDISNILSLGDVTIDGSDLNSGDTLVLPVPEVTSSVHSADDLKGGTMRVYAQADEEEPFEVTLNEQGQYAFIVKPATYTFRYVFEYDGDVAERTFTANIAKFNITADCPTSAVVGQEMTVGNIQGYTEGSAVTVTVTDGAGSSTTLTASEGSYAFTPERVGYYTVRIEANSGDRFGDAEYRFYAREYDMALDFEGVGENRGYVKSYTENPSLNGYVPLSTDWANDGQYSIYFNMVAANVWYGTKGFNISVPGGSNAVTFVANGYMDFAKDVVLWIETDTGSCYSEAFRIKAGVHTYTLRFGATAAGGSVDSLKNFGAVKTLAFACVDTTDRSDVGKYFYMDSVVFHPYSEFDVTFTRPEISLNEEYELTPPTVTSDYLSPEEIEALQFSVSYIGPDGERVEVKPFGGTYTLHFTEAGVYSLTLSYSNRYCTHEATYEYAFGTILFEAELPDSFVTGEDIQLTRPELVSDTDVSDAVVSVSYSRAGEDDFEPLTQRLGKFIFNVSESGRYVLRYTVDCGNIHVSKDYEIFVRQAGVFMDYEKEGSNGYVDTYYGSSHFLPELTSEWSYDGDNSVKVEFRSDGWYGFTYTEGMFTVPEGTDKVSVWVRSDRTFTYASFIAFTSRNSEGSYVWYYTDEFIIEAGVNVYEVGLREYGSLAPVEDLTPSLAGDLGVFTFHTENCTVDSPDFASVVYFDSIRFLNASEYGFSDMTFQPARQGEVYTVDYASPNGFVGENIVISYRRQGESEWNVMYETDAYDGSDITYTFDFTGTVDIRIVAVSGELFATYKDSLTIS